MRSLNNPNRIPNRIYVSTLSQSYVLLMVLRATFGRYHAIEQSVATLETGLRMPRQATISSTFRGHLIFARSLKCDDDSGGTMLGTDEERRFRLHPRTHRITVDVQRKEHSWSVKIKAQVEPRLFRLDFPALSTHPIPARPKTRHCCPV